MSRLVAVATRLVIDTLKADLNRILILPTRYFQKFSPRMIFFELFIISRDYLNS